MIKNLFLLGTPVGKHLYKTAKNYFKGGGKKTKDIMAESNVSKSIAKGDIKDEIKRRAFPKGTRPADFIPRAGRKGYAGTVKAKISDKQSKYQSDLRRFNEGYGRDPRKK